MPVSQQKRDEEGAGLSVLHPGRQGGILQDHPAPLETANANAEDPVSFNRGVDLMDPDSPT